MRKKLMSRNSPLTIPDRVPSNLLDDYIAKEVANHFEHEKLRERVKAIFTDCIETVSFMETVKKYARQEIETKIYQSAGFWAKTILIPIGVTILTLLISRYLKLH